MSKLDYMRSQLADLDEALLSADCIQAKDLTEERLILVASIRSHEDDLTWCEMTCARDAAEMAVAS